MSLKAFHIFFIVCSIFLAGWLGILQLQVFGQTRQVFSFLGAVVGLISASGLAVYLLWFIKKMKDGGKQ